MFDGSALAPTDWWIAVGVYLVFCAELLPRSALVAGTYERHRSEQTLLHQLLEKHFPALVEQLDAQVKCLPEHVRRECDAYLKCGRLEHGFLRVRCDTCYFERLAWAAPCVRLQEARIMPGAPSPELRRAPPGTR